MDLLRITFIHYPTKTIITNAPFNKCTSYYSYISTLATENEIMPVFPLHVKY